MRLFRPHLLLLLLLFHRWICSTALVADGPSNVDHLRVEYLDQPLGLPTLVPRFSWWHTPANASLRAVVQVRWCSGATVICRLIDSYDCRHNTSWLLLPRQP
jgi:hypothetical protein